MQIVLNGEPASVGNGASVASLIEKLHLTGQRVAFELNGEIIPRSRWPEVRLGEGDRAEVVHAIGGG